MLVVPSLLPIRQLLAWHATIAAYDLVATNAVRRFLGAYFGLDFANSAVDAVEGIAAIVLATERQSFRSADGDEFRARFANRVTLDRRKILDSIPAREAGIVHYGTARP